MDSRNRVNVVIAGGGVAALEAALALRELAAEHVDVELLAPEPLFWFRPLSPAEPFHLGEARHFELSRLAIEMGATYSPGELVSVDPANRVAVTAAGGTVPYSALLLACGAVPQPAVEGALTFRGPADTAKLEHVLAEIEAGGVRRLAVAVPPGAAWSLPVYELALLTSAWADERGIDVELALVTAEDEPLHAFGQEVSQAVRALLNERGIAVHTRAHAEAVRAGRLLLAGDGVVPADRVIALPRLRGPLLGGVPQTPEGFVQVDPHGRVSGLAGVFAAGDLTANPVKQGGLAAQQALAAAEAIAAAAGVRLTPRPFRPVLRALLLTGGEPLYLRAVLTPGGAERSEVTTDPLWSPPTKISGKYLPEFLTTYSLAGSRDASGP